MIWSGCFSDYEALLCELIKFSKTKCPKNLKNYTLFHFSVTNLKIIKMIKNAGKSGYPIFPLENKYKGNLGGCSKMPVIASICLKCFSIVIPV